MCIILQLWINNPCSVGCLAPLSRAYTPPSHLPSAVMVDDLHSIYLGEVLHMLHLWLDRKNRRKEYYNIIVDKVNYSVLEFSFWTFLSLIVLLLGYCSWQKAARYSKSRLPFPDPQKSRGTCCVDNYYLAQSWETGSYITVFLCLLVLCQKHF